MPAGAPPRTTVVVRFMDTSDDQGISGWSTLVLAWPLGRFAETKGTSLDPPRVGHYDVTISVSPQVADQLYMGSWIDADEDDIIINGDQYGIFESQDNLIKVLSLSHESNDHLEMRPEEA